MGTDLGINRAKTEFVPVEHHLAHASSAYHVSGFAERPPFWAWTARANTPRRGLAMVRVVGFIG